MRGCIGIDDGKHVRDSGLVTGDTELAREFEQLFRAVYLNFHRRDAPRSQLANASAAVLEHLALAGPLTVGEAAAHLRRAQSVVSEIVSHLEQQGLLERETDPSDRRRTLVWLTAAGQVTLRRHREVLSEELLTVALGRMPREQVDALLGALRALVQSVTPSPAAAGHTEENP
jgi:DNA-binding MarR family transcriptional regulator